MIILGFLAIQKGSKRGCLQEIWYSREATSCLSMIGLIVFWQQHIVFIYIPLKLTRNRIIWIQGGYSAIICDSIAAVSKRNRSSSYNWRTFCKMGSLFVHALQANYSRHIALWCNIFLFHTFPHFFIFNHEHNLGLSPPMDHSYFRKNATLSQKFNCWQKLNWADNQHFSHLKIPVITTRWLK